MPPPASRGVGFARFARGLILGAGVGAWLGLNPLNAREAKSTEPAPVVVAEQPAADTPGARFRLPPPPAVPAGPTPAPAAINTAVTYRLDPSTVRLDFRDGVLHVTVLSGLIRLELPNGNELVILSTGDDIEISGLTPAPDAAAPVASPARDEQETPAPASGGVPAPASPATPAVPTADRPVLVELFHVQGDPADAANHILRLVPKVPIKLRNNGGYPIAVNAHGKLLRLDEGGSGIALDAEGRQITPPNVQYRPRRRPNPAAGGSSATALFKP